VDSEASIRSYEQLARRRLTDDDAGAEIARAYDRWSRTYDTDANATRDPWAIQLNDKVGSVAFDVPVAGYVLWYAHTREIRALLLIVFAGFVLVAALRRIWRNEPAHPAEA